MAVQPTQSLNPSKRVPRCKPSARPGQLCWLSNHDRNQTMAVYINGKLSESLDTIHRRSCLIAEMYESNLQGEEAPSLSAVRERCYSQAVTAAHSWTDEELADWYHNYR